MTSTTDLNLLFGVLAVQLEFVSNDEFINAASNWAADKNRPLSQWLLDAGAIKPNEYKLLEAVVDTHVEKHGNDPSQSLSSLSGSVQLRPVDEDTLNRIRDQEVKDTLGRVSGPSAPELGDPGQTAVYDVSESPGELRYHKMAKVAEGGLGEIWRANDGEVPRFIALKEIKASHADNQVFREQFEFEAMVTGTLEHPGVVPVYGKGVYEDGRPFYGMRFITGMEFSDSIKEHHELAGSGASLGKQERSLRQLLRHFIAVCDVMEYAHSRYVVHRDLKPRNIMIGRYGETLVVDWGLAHVMNEEKQSIDREPSSEAPLPPEITGHSMSSATGGAVEGTPAYMSPEQVDGRSDLFDARTDVYALGAMLFEILVGARPFRGDHDEVFREIRRGAFPRPREHNPRASKQLQAICLKAAALEQKDRYSSARGLGSDVERWLAHDRISAYRESIPQKVVRWARRHKTWAKAVGIAAATILLMMVVFLVLIEQARQREELAREEATRNFTFAQEAADGILDTIREELDNEPGVGPTKRRLLKKAAGLYGKFTESDSRSPKLLKGLGQAKLRLGEVHRELGNLEEAETALRQARAIGLQLSAANEDGSLAILASATTKLARVLNNQSKKSSAARKMHKEALDLQDDLRAKDGSLQVLNGWAEGRINYAVMLLDRNDFATAVMINQEVVDTLQSAIAANRGKGNVWNESNYLIARAYLNMGAGYEEHYDQNQNDELATKAQHAFEKSAEASSELVLASKKPRYHEIYGFALERYALLLPSAENLQVLETALAHYEKLVAGGYEPEYRNGLVGCRMNLGILLETFEGRDAAAGHYQRAFDDGQALLELSVDEPRYFETVANAAFNLARFRSEELSADTDRQSIQAITVAIDCYTELLRVLVTEEEKELAQQSLTQSYYSRFGSLLCIGDDDSIAADFDQLSQRLTTDELNRTLTIAYAIAAKKLEVRGDAMRANDLKSKSDEALENTVFENDAEKKGFMDFLRQELEKIKLANSD